MGNTEGALVGNADGCLVGSGVGGEVGEFVGEAVGTRLGVAVGDADGTALGIADGNRVGGAVGHCGMKHWHPHWQNGSDAEEELSGGFDKTGGEIGLPLGTAVSFPSSHAIMVIEHRQRITKDASRNITKASGRTDIRLRLW